MFIELIDDVKDQILSYCRIVDLKNLSLTNRAYNEEMVPYLFHNVKLDLRYCREATPELLKSIAKIQETVVRLRLSFNLFFHPFNPPALCNALSSFVCLEELCLSSTGWTGVVYELEENETADRTFSKLCRMNTLKTLKVEQCCNITDKGFSNMIELPRLKELHLINTRLSDAGLIKVCELTTLEYLHIEGRKFITDQGFCQISKLFQLKRLHIRCPEIGDLGFSKECELPSLEHLLIGGFKKITVKGFSHMKNLTKLKRFDTVR